MGILTSIMNPDLSKVGLLILVKAAIVIACSLYFLFALIMLRQTTLLSSTLKTKVSPVLTLIAILNLLFTTYLVYLSVVFL